MSAVLRVHGRSAVRRSLMMLRSKNSLCSSVLLALISAASGCAASADVDADRKIEEEDDDVGSIGLELNWSGRDFNMVSWSLTGVGETTRQYQGSLDIS